MTKRLFILLLLLLFNNCLEREQVRSERIYKVDLPDVEAYVLKPAALIGSDMISESSGIVKSRRWDDVYWTHNDSGDEARIFAINIKGELIKPPDVVNYRGIAVKGAKNVDWEDIASDDAGNLVIAACGNNANRRRDLGIYIIKEPDPYNDMETEPAVKVTFYYPEQDFDTQFKKNFDCEAVFWYSGKHYLFTKHRSDNYTVLYRLDSIEQEKQNPVTLIERFNTGQQVTAADVSEDGRKFAILTYNSVWLFVPPKGDKPILDKNFFKGDIFWLPVSAKQCEAVCFDGNRLVITNEQREIFFINIADLIKVQ